MIPLSRRWWCLSRIPIIFAAVGLAVGYNSQALDLDGNGFSDVYEAVYPPTGGYTLLLNGDSDGDGYTDLEEAAFGTDWRDPTSRPITTVENAAGDFSVTWDGVGGIPYLLSHTDTLSFSTVWLPVGGIRVGAGQSISVPVSVGSENRAFWRLSAKQPLDEDGDFLNAYEEALLGTSDLLVDSDDDGNSDVQEFLQGTDAMDPQSYLLPTISKFSGDNQGGGASTISAMPMVVQVTGNNSQPLFHVPVTFSIASGSGALIPERSTPQPTQTVTLYSDERGQVGPFFQFPPTLGSTSQVSATVRGGIQTSVVTFTATTVAAPGNDNFAQALSLNNETLPFSQSSAGATVETGEPVHADTIQGSSVWYSWTAPESGRVEFTTDGSSYDTVLAVYTGSSLLQLTEIASNDDQTEIDPLPLASKVVFPAVQGTTYYIAVAGFAAETGLILLNWGSNSGPSNDFFADAEALNGTTGTLTISNAGATVETHEANHNGEIHSGSLWYRFDSSNQGLLKLSTGTSAIDNVIAVYTGNSIETLDRVISATKVASTSGEVRFVTDPDTTYWIAVAGLGSLTGDLSLAWDFNDSNDFFVNSVPLTGESGAISGSNVDATAEAGEPAHWWYSDYAYHSVWYSWTAPSDGYYLFSTSAATFNHVLAFYYGTSLQSLSHYDSSGGGSDWGSYIWIYAYEGTTFKIAVDGQDQNDFGTFVLNWEKDSYDFMASATSPDLSLATSNPDHVHTGDNCQSCLAHQLQLQADEGALQDDIDTEAVSMSFSSLSECPDPAAPNYGEVISYKNGVESTSKTFHLSIPKAGTPGASNQSCPQTLLIQHKIVTVNTPRSRNLHGKVYFTLKSGDPSVLDIKYNGATYTPGDAIDVVEYGHVGCGVHTWHTGIETFELIGKKKGEVVFEVECDPDPDDGGDGVATKKLELTIKVFEVTYREDPLNALGISANTVWDGSDGYSVDEQSIKQKITIETDPPEIASQINLEVRELDPSVNPDYTPNGIGTIIRTGETEFEYTSFLEPKSEMAPKEKSVTIIAKIDDDELCAKHNVRVLPVFRWLVSLHQHGPEAPRHPPEDSDYETAWRYARWKYDISTSNLSSIVFNRFSPLGADAMVSFSSGSRGARPCIIYESAFTTENYCASVLGHENVHGGQSVNFLILSYAARLTGAFNRKIEYPAYRWQVENADRCGLSAGERDQIITNMNRTKIGQDPL